MVLFRRAYDILGVEPSASSHDITKAYRKKAKQVHPDKNPNSTPEAFHELNEMYKILSDTDTRKQYDSGTLPACAKDYEHALNVAKGEHERQIKEIYEREEEERRKKEELEKKKILEEEAHHRELERMRQMAEEQERIAQQIRIQEIVRQQEEQRRFEYQRRLEEQKRLEEQRKMEEREVKLRRLAEQRRREEAERKKSSFLNKIWPGSNSGNSDNRQQYGHSRPPISDSRKVHPGNTTIDLTKGNRIQYKQYTQNQHFPQSTSFKNTVYCETEGMEDCGMEEEHSVQELKDEIRILKGTVSDLTERLEKLENVLLSRNFDSNKYQAECYWS